jgi:hypothetical protein
VKRAIQNNLPPSLMSDPYEAHSNFTTIVPSETEPGKSLSIYQRSFTRMDGIQRSAGPLECRYSSHSVGDRVLSEIEVLS